MTGQGANKLLDKTKVLSSNPSRSHVHRKIPMDYAAHKKNTVFFFAGYKIIKKIGEGTFSEVVKTQSVKDGKFYACKTMKQTITRYLNP